MLYKSHIFQCMCEIFCVEFQRYPLKFHTKYLTHTLKNKSLWNIEILRALRVKSSYAFLKRPPGNKPLSGPMTVNSLMHICGHRPQWVNSGNCSVPSGSKPLPEPMLMQTHITILHHKATVSLNSRNCEYFRNRWPCYHEIPLYSTYFDLWVDCFG